MSFLPENLNLFLFHPLSFSKQHTCTKDIFPPSFSFCLSFVNKRHTHTHTHTHSHALKNSLVMFWFLSFCGISPLLSALTFIICLFVFVLFCQFFFCFVKDICCSCIAVTKAINTEYPRSGVVQCIQAKISKTLDKRSTLIFAANCTEQKLSSSESYYLTPNL